jgi:hypothetical protein
MKMEDGIVVGLAGSAVTLFTAWLLHKRETVSSQALMEERLRDTMFKFQEKIEQEIKQTKEENEQLRHKVRELEQRVTDLLRINETTIAEKIAWMQKVFILQTRLAQYEQEYRMDRDEIVNFTTEVENLEKEVNENE